MELHFISLCSLSLILIGVVSSRLLDYDEILSLPDVAPDAADDIRTVDEVLAAAVLDSEETASSEGSVLVDMDMIVGPEQYARIFDAKEQKMNHGFAGSGLKDEKTRWPKAIVPYDFVSDFGGYEKNVYSAMKEWMEKTCIRYTPKGSALHKQAGHGNYIKINGDGRGCASHIGYDGYSYYVTLSIKSGCATHGTSLHELGHSLGLSHEHQRIDRDKYLKLNEDNLLAGYESQFVLDKRTDPFGNPYDYCSVMHYGPYAFSKYQISRPTMLTKDPNYQFAIGNPNTRKKLSFYDAKIINDMYKCNAKCEPDRQCVSPCYVNHKCECECPTHDVCEKKPCRDYQSAKVCLDFKKRGMCGKFEWIQQWCAETCGVCEKFTKTLGNDATAAVDKDIPPVVPPTAPSVKIQGKLGPKCKEDTGCKWFANEFACSAGSMMETCPKSCGVCKNCGDKEIFCPDFAAVGKCEFDLKYMLETCNYSCGYCV